MFVLYEVMFGCIMVFDSLEGVVLGVVIVGFVG